MADGDIITAAVLLQQGLLPEQAGVGPAGGVSGMLHGVVGTGGALAVRLSPLVPGPPGLVGWRLGIETSGPGFDLARRPFSRSPGRWWLCCEGCARWVAGLALAGPSEAPEARHWRCRSCLGLPLPAQRLSPRQRLMQALERAEDAHIRRPNEIRQRWFRRLARAEAVRRRASQSAARAEERFNAEVVDLAAPMAEPPSTTRLADDSATPGEGS